MTIAELDAGTAAATDEDRVVDWRARQLRAAGLEELDALELALRRDVDLHVAVRLLRDGCPVATARRILL